MALYQGLGGELNGLLAAKEPDRRKLGFALTGLDYENLLAAEHRGLALAEHSVDLCRSYPPKLLHGDLADEYVRALQGYQYLGQIAQAQRQWAKAEQHYQQALAIYVEFGDVSAEEAERRLQEAAPREDAGDPADTA